MLNNLLSAWPGKKNLFIPLLGRFPKYKREVVGEACQTTFPVQGEFGGGRSRTNSFPVIINHGIDAVSIGST